MSDPPVPAVRASDADRERVAERLRGAAGEGRLTVEELEERLAAAYGSRTHAELEPLTADLPAAEARARPAAGVAVRPGEGGARWLVAIMGGCERTGRWRLAERCRSLNIMGGSDLDLNDVELAARDTQLTVISIMGGADIHVPEGLNVEVSQFAFMGGNSVKLGAESRNDGPTLHLRLFSLMGGTDVKRGRKLSRAERRARRHLGH